MESSSSKLEVTSLIHNETSKTITENGKMGVWKNYKLLIWKMLVQQKRRPISTILELFLPIFFVATLLALRIISVKRTVHDQYVWDGFKVTKEIPSSLSQARSNNWILAYSPNSTYFQKLIQNVPNHLDVKIKGFRNEKMLVDATVLDEDRLMKDQKYLCGVVFDSTPGEFKTRYRLRFPASPRINAKKNSLAPKKWYTQFVYPFVLEGFGPRSPKSKYGGRPSYYNEGFLSVQRAIDFSILETKNSSFNSSNIDVIMRRFPYPRRIVDKFLIVIQTMLPMLIMVSLIYSAILMVKNIVYEKENKLKESMIMMGLKGWMHWLAWFTKCFLFLFISMAIITVLLCVRFGNDNGKMLEASDPSLVFVFLLLYCISAISFCFMLSTFFYRASVSAAGSGVLWFLSYSPYFIIFNYLSQMSLQSNLIACIDFNVAMALGAYMIGRFEGQGAGVQWSNVHQGVTVDDDFVFGHVLIMLAIDSIFYGIITWYIDGIFPGEFGIPKKWYFPVTKRYWFGTKNKTTRGAHSDDGVDVENKEINASDFIEKEPENLKIGVQIKNLVKNFKTDSGIKVAVNKLNLNMYEGDITALLGHNGAGKTTTISMLTGLFPPTSGNAVINGYDILENIDCVRKSLGICPQHNVLFDLLTVEEHLCFFTYLKGIMKDEDLVKKEVERMIKLIGLEEKRDTQSKYLSGGMKRKLSVGIALTGGSTVVMLDEPTSGMDVSARRFTWDLLQKEKSGRTILLTTHFMDEADVLGDRIAIMADGEIRCCGSSLFLKKKYGVGYHMVLVKNNNFDTKTMTNLIKSYIPNVQLESNIGMEISFILPNDFSHKFEGLFSEIENRREDLGVASFGASVTTLEEVFFKVGETYGSNEITDDQKYVTADSLGRSASTSINEPTEKERISVLNKGITLIVQRWCAMLMKKIIYSKRHKSSIISQFIMPALFVMMAMIAIKVMPKSTSSPPRLITLQMFSSNKVTLKQLGRSTFLQKLSVSYKAEVMDLTSKLPNEPKSNVTNYILELQKIDLPKFNLDHLVALSLNDKTKATATAWFNNEAIHTAPVSLNMLTNALLAMYTGNSTNQISVTNEPLPVTTKQGLSDIMVNPVGFQVGFSLCFGMAFLASSFIVSLVQERASKAKHLQYVSGVDPITYWTSSYFWDLVNFVFPCICVLIIFVAFADECFSGDRLGYVMLLLILYGWAIIPLMYIFSFAFQNASTAFTRMTIFNNVTSMTMMIVVSVLMIPQLDLADVSRTLKWTFMMFPTYCLGQGTVDMFNNYQTIEFFYAAVDLCVETGFSRSWCENVVEEKFKSEFKMSFQMNYLSWYNPGIGRYLVFLSTEGIVYFLIVFLIEYDMLNKLRTICRGRKTLLRVSSRSNSAYTDDEVPSGSVPAVDFSKSTVSTARERLRSLDDDVTRERERIMKDVRGNDVLVFSELTKVFNPSKNDELVAVDGISLGIPHGECFGLLGQNGAGKTTTFRMLTGDEKITSGLAFVDGFNVNTNLSQARQRIGYCPQFDALIELMTGREILTMYARLRGVQEEDIQPMIDILAKYLTFDMYLDKISKTYSGGNKRKLSTAIALIGDPPLVFLDEPSCGMDPVARRMLWDSLSKLISSGRSIIITSHSMEECEALCTRLAIMVNGQFKCLGSPQHLKNKFGEGYTLVARVGGMNPSTERLQQHIEELFPGSILKDLHDGYVHYQLITDKNWSYIFGEVEKMKGDHDIEDYSVSQTTLEQIFLNFTRTQKVVDE